MPKTTVIVLLRECSLVPRELARPYIAVDLNGHNKCAAVFLQRHPYLVRFLAARKRIKVSLQYLQVMFGTRFNVSDCT
jgi:hypothetical protein